MNSWNNSLNVQLLLYKCESYTKYYYLVRDSAIKFYLNAFWENIDNKTNHNLECWQFYFTSKHFSLNSGPVFVTLNQWIYNFTIA